MTKPLFILLIGLGFSGCVNQVEPLHENDTPIVLNNPGSISSISKRGTADIISQLYEEALENNTELSLLHEQIMSVYNTKQDSLSTYNTYIQTNSNYWNTVNGYVNRIKDSTLKLTMQNTFETLKNSYNDDMWSHLQLTEQIERKSIQLNDQLLVLKLLITQPLMRNYQINERPDIAPLEFLKDYYSALIHQAKNFNY